MNAHRITHFGETSLDAMTHTPSNTRSDSKSMSCHCKPACPYSVTKPIKVQFLGQGALK